MPKVDCICDEGKETPNRFFLKFLKQLSSLDKLKYAKERKGLANIIKCLRNSEGLDTRDLENIMFFLERNQDGIDDAKLDGETNIAEAGWEVPMCDLEQLVCLCRRWEWIAVEKGHPREVPYQEGWLYEKKRECKEHLTCMLSKENTELINQYLEQLFDDSC